MAIGEIRITDNLDELLAILPPDIAGPLKKMSGLLELIEVVLDLGRRPEARFESHFTYLKEEFVTTDEIKFVVDRVCKFGGDNRAGIPRTLHRISAIKNRTNDIIGLTLRVGRAVYGTISLISDLVNTDRSILLMGRPGVGKTTMLREMARVLADDFQKRVVIVDTSNEIAGDGDIPHPGIGLARRMQVPHHDLQHEVMIEAVQNHMPEVIVVDEIGTEQEAYAARTIAERGVQLIATAHGNSLTNLLLNPTLSDLVGGIQAVTLSDEEARRRGTQKTVLERKAPPTFDVVIEIHEKDRLAIHENVDTVVDQILRGVNPQPEIRERDEKGGFKVVQARSLPPSKAVFQNGMKNNRGKASGRPDDYPFSHEEPPPVPHLKRLVPGASRTIRIFPYAVSRNRIEKAVEMMKLKAVVVRHMDEADVILTLKSQEHKGTKKIRELAGTVPIHSIRSNTVAQIQSFLKSYFQVHGNHCGREEEEAADPCNGRQFSQREKQAMEETEIAIKEVLRSSRPVEMAPQNSYIRRLQHQLADKYSLMSSSLGQEPFRRVSIFTTKSGPIH